MKIFLVMLLISMMFFTRKIESFLTLGACPCPEEPAKSATKGIKSATEGFKSAAEGVAKKGWSEKLSMLQDTMPPSIFDAVKLVSFCILKFFKLSIFLYMIIQLHFWIERGT